MYFKCCVKNCLSTRHDVILHKFPANEKRLNKWLQCLEDHFSGSLANIRNLFVCHKHFENRFVSATFRLLTNALPTLFTLDEISSGIPDKITDNIKLVTDNSSKEHCDHTYCKDELLTSANHGDRKSINPCKETAKTCLVKDDTIGGTVVYLENNKAHNADGDPISIASEYTVKMVPSVDDDSYSIDAAGVVLENDKVPQRELFSWEQSESTVPCEKFECEYDDAIEENLYITSEVPEDKERDGTTLPLLPHEGFTCNICSSDIVGFRYTCVQCADFDLCGSCEASRHHPAHYVLRVPSHRPQSEVFAKLQIIRRALLSDAIIHVDGDGSPIEVKEETDPIDFESTHGAESDDGYTEIDILDASVLEDADADSVSDADSIPDADTVMDANNADELCKPHRPRAPDHKQKLIQTKPMRGRKYSLNQAISDTNSTLLNSRTKSNMVVPRTMDLPTAPKKHVIDNTNLPDHLQNKLKRLYHKTLNAPNLQAQKRSTKGDSNSIISSGVHIDSGQKSMRDVMRYPKQDTRLEVRQVTLSKGNLFLKEDNAHLEAMDIEYLEDSIENDDDLPKARVVKRARVQLEKLTSREIDAALRKS